MWIRSIAAAIWLASQIANAEVLLPRSHIAWLGGGHTFAPTFLEFSRDGKLLYSASGDGSVKVWDVASRIQTRSWFERDLGEFGVSHATIAADGEHVAAYHFRSDAIRVFRLGDGVTEQIVRMIPRLLLTLSLSSDRNFIAFSSYNHPLEVRNLVDGSRVVRSFTNRAGETTNAFFWTQFVGNRELLAAGAREVARFSLDADAAQWRVTNLTNTGIFAISNDRGVVAAAQPDELLLVGTSAGQIERTIPLPRDDVSALRFSRHNRMLAVGYRSGIVEIRRLSDGQVDRTLTNLTRTVHQFAWTPDQLSLVVSSGDQTILWPLTGDLESEVLFRTTGPIRKTAAAPGGQRVYAGSGDGTVDVFDSNTGKRIGGWKAAAGRVQLLAHSPTEDLLVTNGQRDGEVRFWRASRGELLHSTNALGNVPAGAQFSSDGARLLAFDAEANMVVFTAPDWNILNRLSIELGNYLRTVELSPDGELIAAVVRDRSIRLLDVRDGKLRATLRSPGAGPGALGFLNDGTELASVGVDGRVDFWDRATGELARSLVVGATNFSTAAFTPDGSLLVIGSRQSGLTFWRTDIGQLLARLDDETGGHLFGLSFDSTGERFYVGRLDGTLVAGITPFFISEPAVRDGALEFQVRGASGLYHVERRTVNEPNWHDVQAIQNGPTISVQIPDSPASYRVHLPVTDEPRRGLED